MYFFNPDALEAYEFAQEKRLIWKEQPLTVSLLEAVPNDLFSHAVTVSNIEKVPASNIEELLTLFFENAKSSNGGTIRKIALSEDGKAAVISFQEQEGKL